MRGMEISEIIPIPVLKLFFETLDQMNQLFLKIFVDQGNGHV